MKKWFARFMVLCMVMIMSVNYQWMELVNAKNSTAKAKIGNATDTIYFGDTTSETAHNFINDLNYSSNSEAGIDDGTLIDGLGDGLTFRYLTVPSGDTRSMIEFTLKASTTSQNYLTIRMNGSQTAEGNLLLLGENGDTTSINPIMETVWAELDNAYDYGEDSAPFEGRYYYDTYIIPINMVKSDGTVTLCIAATGASSPYGTGTWNTQTINSKYIYSAATHTDACYEPADNLDNKHSAPAQNAPVTDTAAIAEDYIQLSEQINEAMETVMSWQFYGDYWEQSVKNSNNAYLEGAVISLKDITTFSKSTYQTYSKAQWAKIAAQYGINYQNWEVFGTTSLYVTALTHSYSGEEYYENTDFLDRIFATYDFIERAQEESGGWCIPIEGDSAYTWLGADYDGTGERKTTSYYSPLMKLGSDFLVESFIELCNYIKNCENEDLKTAFYTKLNEKIDGDLTGVYDRTRRDYYTDMFARLRDFLAKPNGKDFYDPSSRAGTTNQDLGFAYFANEAVRILYDTKSSGYSIDSDYGVEDSQEYIQQLEYKLGEMADGEKWFSENVLGLELGASRGGWAGDYGALIIKQVARYAEIGQYFEDSEVTELLNNLADKVFNSASYFMIDSTDSSTHYGLLDAEVVASSRNNGYTQKLFYNLGGYVATVLGNNTALRIMQKYIEDNRADTDSISEYTQNSHVYDRLTTAQEIVKYYEEIAATVTPGKNKIKYLPMEEENSNDFVWYDYDGQVVVFKNTLKDGTVDKAYFTLNYRRSSWSYNGISRIHFTSGATTTAGKSDRIANVVTDNQGGIYTYLDSAPNNETYTHHRYNGYSEIKYGNYIVAMNQSQTDSDIGQEGDTYTLNTTGVKKAVDIVTGKKYVGKNGQDITVTAGEKSVVILYIEEYVEPVTVSATYTCNEYMLGYDTFTAKPGDIVTVEAPDINGYGLAEDQTSSYTFKVNKDSTQNIVNFEYTKKGKPAFSTSSGSSSIGSWSVSLTNDAQGSLEENTDGSLTLTANTVDSDNLSKIFAYQEVTDDFSFNTTLDSVLYKKSDHDYYSMIITDSLDLSNANYIELRYWLNNSNIGLCYHDSTMGSKTSQYGWAKDKNGINSATISGITFDLTKDGDTISYKYSLDGGTTYTSLSKSTVDFATLSDSFFQSDRVYAGVALTSGYGDGAADKAANVVTVSNISISNGVAKAPVSLGETVTLDFNVTDEDGAAIYGLNMSDLNDTTYYNTYDFKPETEGSYEIKAIAYNTFYTDPSSKTELVYVGDKQHADLADINDMVITEGNTATFSIPQDDTTKEADITCVTYRNEEVVDSSYSSNIYTFTPTKAGTYNVLVKYDFENYIVTKIVKIKVTA